MKPNILFILVDQMRPDSLNRKLTPNLMKLAQQGAQFAHAYSPAPLCQPARNCIVHGSYPTMNGICGNQVDPISAEKRKDCYPAHLQEAGYYTAMIGKHHFIDRWYSGLDVIQEDDQEVKQYGFDYVWQVVDDHIHNRDRYTAFLETRGKLEIFQKMYVSRKWDPEALLVEEFDDGFIGESALQFLDQYREAKPFFLNVSFLGPHPPHWAVQEYHTMFNPEDSDLPKCADEATVQRAKEARAKYYGRVKLMDDYVGKLLEKLDEKGFRENTLVVFTADHGDCLGDYGIFDKRYFYEQSAGVPLILSGAGIEVFPRIGGAFNQNLVSTIDLYPTFLEAAGCSSILGDPAEKREGISLLSMLAGTGHLRDAVFSELGTLMMVRDAHWKLVFDAEGGGVLHLYNLLNDPQELTNLAGVPEYRGIEAGLVERLLSRLIRLTHFTQEKEQWRLQRVRVAS